MSKNKSSGAKKKNRLRWLWPLAVSLFLLITLAAAGYFIFLSPGPLPTPDTPPREKPLTPSVETKKKPTRKAIEPRDKKRPTAATVESRDDTKKIVAGENGSTSNEDKGRLAIIIDDMGEQHETGRALLDLDMPLSFSFLPFASHTSDLLQTAKELKRDILLHLPMEPEDGRWDPGRGALYTAMSPVRIEVTVAADLTAVPEAIGVNNHMGSRFTADRKAMTACLNVIEKKGLFFVDSLTSSRSVAWSLAREAGMLTAKRDLFLDNARDVTAIKASILALIEIANRHGRALGIGHPHRETFEALRQSREILHREVRMVAVHELVEKNKGTNNGPDNPDH